MVSPISNSTAALSILSSFPQASDTTSAAADSTDNDIVVTAAKAQAQKNSEYQDNASENLAETQSNGGLEEAISTLDERQEMLSSARSFIENSDKLSASDKKRLLSHLEGAQKTMDGVREFYQSDIGKFVLSGGKFTEQDGDGNTIHYVPGTDEVGYIEPDINYTADVQKITDLKAKYQEF